MKSAMYKSVAVLSVVASSLFVTAAHANPAENFYSSKNLRPVETAIPEYPRVAQMSGIEGYTVVEFTVMPDGSVAEPAIADSSFHLFSRAALAAIESWKFEPVAAEAGEAIPVRSSLKFSFVGAER